MPLQLIAVKFSELKKKVKAETGFSRINIFILNRCDKVEYYVKQRKQLIIILSNENY